MTNQVTIVPFGRRLLQLVKRELAMRVWKEEYTESPSIESVLASAIAACSTQRGGVLRGGLIAED